MSKIDNKFGSGGLGWVILLLGVAVILPTVCLLWFMVQAVRNERLAVRQKLVDEYKRQLDEKVRDCESGYESMTTSLIKGIRRSGYLEPVMRNYITMSPMGEVGNALIVYDSSGELEYPVLEKASEYEVEDERLEKVWQAEFADEDYALAIEQYCEIIEDANDKNVKCQAMAAKARCLVKKQKYFAAIEVCRDLFSIDPGSAILINNYVMLIELYIKTGQNYDELAEGLLGAVGDSDRPLSVREFGLEKLKAITENGNNSMAAAAQGEYRRISLELKTQRRSVNVAEMYPEITSYRNWQAGTVQRVEFAKPCYAIFMEDGAKRYVLVGGPDLLFQITGAFEKSFICRVVDNLGGTYRVINYPTEYLLSDSGQVSQILKNANADDKPMLAVGLGEFFPGWVLELYPKDGDIFESAASRQAAIYTWTGLLVVVLILGSGLAAGQVVGRQIRLNRLKNDFIATVTHELKTPLASMRVLVDTLLEERCESEGQAREYLQLISKENVRLSRLIDNFLTFSRMERNKQAFEMVEADAGEIARAAAEAVQTKFSDKKCEFSISIEEGLKPIRADQDAMVTVLVNLLDNAYKYSYNEKRIELRVYSEEGNVCFSVKDNGIGMSRRQVKKVFDRFYQVDSSLARSAEGTGLGLSIVKFVVDAHKGEIEVESRLGKGSEFVVKL